MARIGSQQVAGFFATPTHLLPVIASYLRFELPPPPEKHWVSDYAHISALDPCAGEGEALVRITQSVDAKRLKLYAVELEGTRAKVCAKAIEEVGYQGGGQHALHGDAFRVTFDGPGAGLLFLNPPYDTDKQFRRLEARFLHRFTSALAVGGTLVFIVPHYALEACADHLAQHYGCVRGYRFPGEDFNSFRQCVVFAERRDAMMSPDPAIAATVREWARDCGTLRELVMRDEPQYDVLVSNAYGGAFKSWLMMEADYTAILAKHRPWHMMVRGGGVEPIPGLMPTGQIRDSLLRVYPVATPPRPAHIAAGIAAGVFNGARITPNAECRFPLPDLLVKGVFDREFKTIEVRQNKHGETTGEVQVQQPRLVTTILDLSKGTFHRLGDGAESTGATDVAKMNVADLLACYGHALMEVMARQCPTLYDPRRDAAEVELVASPRTLFNAQAHASRALVKLLRQPDHSAILLGEIGSGKSTASVMAARTFGAQRLLVMCPPHLLQSWRNEVAAVAPDMALHVLETIEDLGRLPPGPSVTVLSRETAKLSHGIAQVHGACPKCGMAVPAGDLAKRRAHCEAKVLRPLDAVARAAYALASHLLSYSHSATIPMVMRGRFDSLRVHKQKRRGSVRKPASEWFTPPPDAMFGDALAKLTRSYLKEPSDDPKARALFALCFAVGREDWTTFVVANLLTSANWAATQLARSILLMVPPEHQAQHYKVESSAWDYSAVAHLKNLEELADGEEIKPYSLACAVKRVRGEILIDSTSARSLQAYENALDRLAHIGHWRESAECGEPLYQAIPEPRRISLAKYITRYHKGSFDFLILDECFVAGTMVSGRPIETIRIGDVVDSYDEVTGRLVKRRVTRLFINRPSGLVRVRFDTGQTFVCTPGHPVFTEERGWVPALRLTPRDTVLRVDALEREAADRRHVRALRGAGDMVSSGRDVLPATRLRLLFNGLRSQGEGDQDRREQRGLDETQRGLLCEAHAGEQPDARSGKHREDGREEEGLHVHRARRQRTADGAAATTVGGLGLADRGSDSDGARRRAVSIAAAPLQGGHRGCGAEVGDRGGRRIAQAPAVEVLGPSQGIHPARARVDRVEVLEPGRDGTFGGVCADGLVYNLEVDGTHTYLAEGVVVHNCHELATDGSAQSNAGERLSSMRLPTIRMTGSIMNGYAESMFVNSWSTSSDFRREFARDEKQRFIDRFGYRKRIVEDRVDGKVVEYGSQSDRVTRCERMLGNAPGVLPLFVLRHLLPVSVTLHKADLAIDLPVCHQIKHRVQPTPEQRNQYLYLLEALKRRIKSDMWEEGRAGKLFGQLAELPSYLDRATRDVGNCESGAYENPLSRVARLGDGRVVAWLPRGGAAPQRGVDAGDRRGRARVWPQRDGLLVARVAAASAGPAARGEAARARRHSERGQGPDGEAPGVDRSRGREQGPSRHGDEPGRDPDGTEQPRVVRVRALDGESRGEPAHVPAGHRACRPHRPEARHADPLPRVRGHAAGQLLRPAHEEGRGLDCDRRARSGGRAHRSRPGRRRVSGRPEPWQAALGDAHDRA